MTFNCKPFKYSYEGQQTIADGNPRLTATNPTAFDSRPYIKIYGSGTVRLMLTPSGQGTTTWVLSDVDEYIKIDSELMNCYKDTVLKNDTVTGEGFPVLNPEKTPSSAPEMCGVSRLFRGGDACRYRQ